MRAARIACAVVGLGGLLLAGCKIAPPRTTNGPGADAPWTVQRAALAHLDRYGLSGRVAVAANGQGFSASLRYQQQPQRSDLSLDGPLGIGGVRVALEGDEVRIATSRGEQLDGVAARAELERRLGFALPLDELRWWLLGLPAPGAAELNEDSISGEIHDFTQGGWHVTIGARAPGLGFALPQRMTVEREGARMKLLVERWQP